MNEVVNARAALIRFGIIVFGVIIAIWLLLGTREAMGAVALVIGVFIVVLLKSHWMG